MPRIQKVSDPFRSLKDFDNGVPGPGKYSPNGAAIRPASHSFSFRLRTSDHCRSMQANPSPNKYHTENRPFRTEAGRYSLHCRTKDKPFIETPSPNKYKPNLGIYDVDHIAFTARIRPKTPTRNKTNIGPSKYRNEKYKSIENNKDDVTAPCTAKFSVRSRYSYKMFEKEMNPGPAKYCRAYESSTFHEPEFTMRNRCQLKDISKDAAWMRYNHQIVSNQGPKFTAAQHISHRANTITVGFDQL